MINGHGNNLTGIQDKIVADFSTNVYNNPQTDEILNYLKSQVDVIRNYPDCNCSALREKIAANSGLKAENVFISNGSTEAFYLLAHAFAKADSVIPVPSFSEYQDACKLYHHNIEFVQNTIKWAEYPLNNKLLWLGNPNNPDGKYYSPNEIINLLEQNPSTQIIVDEAYIDLCSEGKTVAGLVKDYKNLIVIKSFTKLFAIPGIRLGYVLAQPEVISNLQQHHMPWAVNSLALKVGEYIVDQLSDKCCGVKELLAYSKQLQQELSELPELEVIPSSCNYFLVRSSQGKASELKHFLIEKYGFLIRDAANFNGLDEQWFRVAAQNVESNNKLIIAIRRWLKEN